MNEASFARARKARLLVGALAAGVLLPFIGKPYHVDDVLFLKQAARILETPFDPFGGTVIWYLTARPIFEVMQNPPLMQYLLAIIGGASSFSEPVVHLALMVPAVATIAGVAALAQRLRAPSATSALLVIASPIWLVSCTNVMCDGTLCCLWVWAVATFVRALDERRTSLFIVAGLLAGAAFVTKYSAIALLPLLCAYGAVRERRLGAWLWFGLPFLAVMASYETWCSLVYGRSHVLQASAYSAGIGGAVTLQFRLGCALAMLGGGAGAAAWLACLTLGKRGVAVLAGAFLGAVALGMSSKDLLGPLPFHDGSFVAQFLLWTALGIGTLVALVWFTARSMDSTSVLLLLWIGAVFVFAAVFNWTVNARALLPAVPAVALFCARQLAGHPRSQPVLAVGCFLSIALAVAVADGDERDAKARRDTAYALLQRASGQTQTLWFQGHWGIQRYLEEGGALAFDNRASLVEAGDWVAIPEFSPPTAGAAPGWEPLFVVDVPRGGLVTAMEPTRRAGFYSSFARMPLPFALGAAPAYRTTVWRVPRSKETAASTGPDPTAD